jgi:outer membrane protein assembly factor BamA
MSASVRVTGERIFSALVTFVLLTRATTVAAPAPTTVRSLECDGLHAFSPAEVRSWCVNRPGAPFVRARLESDLLTLIAHYQEAGYLAAEVHLRAVTLTSDSTFADILLDVKEGKKSVYAGLHVRGNTVFKEEQLRREFDLAPGDPVHQQVIEEGIARVLALYERSGYPYARCTIDSVLTQSVSEIDSLGLFVGVQEGGRVTIDEISVRGVKETDPSVVTRETRITPGEAFDAAKVEAIRERLLRLNIFSAVEEPDLYHRGGHTGLLITVQEGNTSTFDGVVGYVPGAPPLTQGYVTGLASVSMRNLFGTGRKLAARWQRTDRATQELDVRYGEPWLLNLPLNLEGGFFLWQQDSAYVLTRWDLRAEFMLSENFSVSGIFNAEQAIPSADVPIPVVSRSRTISTGAEFLYDSRDDAVSPSAGGRFRADYLYGTKRRDSVSAGVQRIGVDLQFYVSVAKRQVVALGLHGRQATGRFVEASEMYRLGGFATLRGYRENQFLGNVVGWSNLEYRFLMGRRTYLFGFLDAGYYSRSQSIAGVSENVKGLKTGFGAGVRMDTSLGNIGVSLALGQGDGIGQAKVHIGLINEF